MTCVLLQTSTLTFSTKQNIVFPTNGIVCLILHTTYESQINILIFVNFIYDFVKKFSITLNEFSLLGLQFFLYHFRTLRILSNVE